MTIALFYVGVDIIGIFCERNWTLEPKMFVYLLEESLYGKELLTR